MSWPWAKRHPMPEPAEFIRQNTTALNPDIESGILSPAQALVRDCRASSYCPVPERNRLTETVKFQLLVRT